MYLRKHIINTFLLRFDIHAKTLPEGGKKGRMKTGTKQFRVCRSGTRAPHQISSTEFLSPLQGLGNFWTSYPGRRAWSRLRCATTRQALTLGYNLSGLQPLRFDVYSLRFTFRKCLQKPAKIKPGQTKSKWIKVNQTDREEAVGSKRGTRKASIQLSKNPLIHRPGRNRKRAGRISGGKNSRPEIRNSKR